MRAGLYLHALRAARGRQLRARVLRPVRRGRFPLPSGSASFRPLDVPLWRSAAFAGCDVVAGDGLVRQLGKELAFPPADWALPGEPRLRRFHLQYGEEVLGWARRGELGAAGAALEAWIVGNPPRRGDAWHPYPLSTRVGNWVAALSLAPELVGDRVVESLRRQLAHLGHNVEDDVLGNHLVRNARAFVLGGAALGDRRLVERGLALLRRELPEQVLPDGGHYERSPVYHLLVLRDLLEIRAATGDEWLELPIEAMRRFAAGLQRPDGAPALFNEGGLDLAPRLDLPEPPQGLAVFPETGYVVLRSGPLWLAFDCGPPAPPFLPAHAHADALSLQLWWDGEPVLVDTGTSTYEPGPERDRLRSTRSHSTVAIDGKDQFVVWRAFRAGPLPQVRLSAAGGDGVEASVLWPGGIRHIRRVEWSGSEVVVRDRVLARGRHRIESRLVLAPGERKARIEALEAGASVVAEQGWVSERLDERSSVDVLVLRRETDLSETLGWCIRCVG